jgi:T-complex protein 11
MIRNDDKNLTLSRFDAKLIRQVLLTDDFEAFHDSKVTPWFSEFQSFDGSDPETIMKRAFRDHVVAQEDDSSQRELIHSLHESIRSLIPNRKDLHDTIVNDASIGESSGNPRALLLCLVHASEALQSLESEARAITTEDWRRLAIEKIDSECSVEFMVSSAMYLLLKAELCQADAQDFYLQNIWAPQIHMEGPSYLQNLMDKKFGDYSITKTWLKNLMQDIPVVDENDKCAFRNILGKGWVQDILFCKHEATILPEIFSFDMEALIIIREACQKAVIASSLMLHCGITKRVDPQSDLGFCLERLLTILSNYQSDAYEANVSNTVVALAKENGTLADETTLRNITLSTLKGQDPVIVLLNRRVQDTFLEMISKEGPIIPNILKSGVQDSIRSRKESGLEHVAEDLFYQRGILVYTFELAKLSVLSRKIVDLTHSIHQGLIENTLQNVLTNSS